MREIKDFLNSEKEAFKILNQKIKSIDTIAGISTIKELQGRQHAKRIIYEWLTELWGIAYPELPEPDEDDDIFKLIENPKINN